MEEPPNSWIQAAGWGIRAVLSLGSGLPAGFPPLRQMNPNQQLRINHGGGGESSSQELCIQSSPASVA